MYIYIFTIILFTTTITISSGQSGFEARVLRLGNIDRLCETAIPMQINNNDHYVLSYIRYIDVYNTSYPSNYTEGSTITPTSSYINLNAKDNVAAWSSTNVGDVIYSITSFNILWSNLSEPFTSGTIPFTNGSIPLDIISDGAFTFVGKDDTKVFIIDSIHKKLYYLLINITTNDIPSTLSSIDINDLVEGGWTFAQDNKNGLLFVADTNGSIATFNMNNLTIQPTIFKNSSLLNIGAMTMDTTNCLLFICAKQKNYASTMHILKYSATATTMSTISTLSYNMTISTSGLLYECAAAAYDPVQGQIFFIGTDDSGLAVIGAGTRAGMKTNFISFFSDIPTSVYSDVIGRSINTSNSILTLVTSRDYIELTYKTICDDDCNGQGSCLMGVCHCNSNHSGDTCQINLCLSNCSGHGVCKGGECQCEPNYQSTEDCSVFGCYMNCSKHGDCITEQSNGGNQTYLCHCHDGFTGLYCELAVPVIPITNTTTITATTTTTTATPITTTTTNVPSGGNIDHWSCICLILSVAMTLLT
ncbi:hypothetical protein SAMD00019534_030010, partial [Acytostelium subglobosum LB1]|uniref:hypothetical protein n=1 Tax=Acytostelium subglobosum LB1 TaxID=1410327 RepID=UPI0006447F0B